jgi:hypothetical protein
MAAEVVRINIMKLEPGARVDNEFLDEIPHGEAPSGQSHGRPAD